MGIDRELGLKKPFTHRPHEAVLNIVLTGTELAKEGSRILKPYGLTDTQFNVLMLLKDHADHGRINQTELGRMLLVNRSNITGIVDRMERDGMVKRLPDPSDRRVNWIEMTEAGADVLAKARKAYYTRIEAIMGGLDEKACNNLCAAMESVRTAIRNAER